MNFNLTPADQLEIRRQGIAKAFGIDIQKADKPDGHWVTSEETGKHIFIGADGQPKYTREQIEGGSGSLGGVADEPSSKEVKDKGVYKVEYHKNESDWRNGVKSTKEFDNFEDAKNFTNTQTGNHMGGVKLIHPDKESSDDIKDSKMTVSKLEDKSSDSFEKKYGTSLEDLVNQINESKGSDIDDIYNKVTGNSAYARNEGDKVKEFTTNLLNELNEKGLKLKKKIEAKGIELKSIPVAPPKYNKEGLDSLFDKMVSKDKDRVFMSGVHVDGDKLIATDAHKLVILKHNDPELTKMSGKTINSDKKEIINPKKNDNYNQKFPDYEAVIPQNNPYKADETIDNLLSIANGAVNSFKNIKDTPEAIPFKIGGSDTIFMNPNILLDTLKVLKGNGANKVKVSASVPNRAITFETDNGHFALAMPVMGWNGSGEMATTQEFKLGKD